MTDLMHDQLAAQFAQVPGGAEMLPKYDVLMANFIAGKPFVADPGLPEGVNNLVKGFYEPVNLPFTRELFATTSGPMLAQMTVPTLVIIGKKDIQVNWQADGSLNEKAAAGKANITFAYPETANHILKYEVKPFAELSGADSLQYNASDKVLDTDTMKIIKDWLAAKSK